MNKQLEELLDAMEYQYTSEYMCHSEYVDYVKAAFELGQQFITEDDGK